MSAHNDDVNNGDARSVGGMGSNGEASNCDARSVGGVRSGGVGSDGMMAMAVMGARAAARRLIER